MQRINYRVRLAESLYLNLLLELSNSAHFPTRSYQLQELSQWCTMVHIEGHNGAHSYLVPRGHNGAHSFTMVHNGAQWCTMVHNHVGALLRSTNSALYYNLNLKLNNQKMSDTLSQVSGTSKTSSRHKTKICAYCGKQENAMWARHFTRQHPGKEN